jgi:hypothetical protein
MFATLFKPSADLYSDESCYMCRKVSARCWRCWKNSHARSSAAVSAVAETEYNLQHLRVKSLSRFDATMS